MKQLILRFLGKIPFFRQKIEIVEKLWVLPGHYYSPIPSDEDIQLGSKLMMSFNDVLGVDSKSEDQFTFLKECAEYYRSIPWKSDSPRLRYQFENDMYSYGDGIFYFFILQRFKPKKIIEIGSGWTTALALDVRENFGINFNLSAIEPYPERLYQVIRPDDDLNVSEEKVQNVPINQFKDLGENDILFIDSSHVSKFGGDVNFIYFEILPRLNPGVLVHVHDIHSHFEYPERLIQEGRSWNEAYMLRALLSNSNRYSIVLWSDFIIKQHQEWIEENMPMCNLNPGGSIWFKVNA